jgi:glycosyltransferase involved in cell wall biosynthesis
MVVLRTDMKDHPPDGDGDTAGQIRVAYLAPGSSVHANRWLTALHDRGYEVELITMHRPRAGSALPHAVRVHQLPFPAPVGYYLNTWPLRALLLQLKPTFLHAHYATGYGTLSRLAAFHPTLLSVWGSDVLVFPTQARWKRHLVRRNLLAADYLASTSHTMRRAVEQLVGDQRPVGITPFGVDCQQFHPTSRQQPAGALTIGSVKALEPTAGLDTLIQAFAMLAHWHAGEGLRLLIVGDGPERMRLERLTRSVGAQAGVNFVGAVPHHTVPHWAAKMDIFAAISRSEGFGVGVLEASACGLPVVVSDVGGLREVVRDGETGLVVSSRDPEAVARALETLLCDPELRARMGAAGRAFVIENYEWSKTVDVMVGIYRNMMQSDQQRSKSSV